MPIIAQLRLLPSGSLQSAAVRLPPAEPREVQRSGRAPETPVWPLFIRHLRLGSRRFTRAIVACSADAAGQGWPERQVPSVSRAAIPWSRNRGPSAHQTGPSPSQTRVGVHVKSVPLGAVKTEAAIAIASNSAEPFRKRDDANPRKTMLGLHSHVNTPAPPRRPNECADVSLGDRRSASGSALSDQMHR